MTTQVILIIVIVGLAIVCGCLVIINSRLRMKDDKPKYDDTDMMYWDKNNF